METEPARRAGHDDLRTVSERIETLLEASTTAGAVQRQRAEELVGLVTDLYGNGLERILHILDSLGRLDDDALAALVGDDLVSGLLLVHGLHPYPVEQRIEAALTRVRPYLGSHGGNVELVDVDELGVVTLRLLGSCDGCPSSAVTLQLAVEGAVEDAAPEITGIEVVTPTSPQTAGLISVDSLRSRLGETPPGDVEWTTLPGLAQMVPGEVAGFSVGNVDVFACAVDGGRFVYRDVCPRCGGSLAGTAISESDGQIAVRCPTCHIGYDVRRAGANIAGGPEHLDPLPALESGGEWRVAVPVQVSA
jgi:Fe-S cluster biogenesis protein NfuA/nitrite reductase/ring-hydroxylating ferredoxin subunit